jgi:hypothetical protein
MAALTSRALKVAESSAVSLLGGRGRGGGGGVGGGGREMEVRRVSSDGSRSDSRHPFNSFRRSFVPPNGRERLDLIVRAE